MLVGLPKLKLAGSYTVNSNGNRFTRVEGSYPWTSLRSLRTDVRVRDGWKGSSETRAAYVKAHAVQQLINAGELAPAFHPVAGPLEVGQRVWVAGLDDKPWRALVTAPKNARGLVSVRYEEGPQQGFERSVFERILRLDRPPTLEELVLSFGTAKKPAKSKVRVNDHRVAERLEQEQAHREREHQQSTQQAFEALQQPKRRLSQPPKLPKPEQPKTKGLPAPLRLALVKVRKTNEAGFTWEGDRISQPTLLQHVEQLANLGEVVRVGDGYAVPALRGSVRQRHRPGRNTSWAESLAAAQKQFHGLPQAELHALVAKETPGTVQYEALRNELDRQYEQASRRQIELAEQRRNEPSDQKLMRIVEQALRRAPPWHANSDKVLVADIWRAASDDLEGMPLDRFKQRLAANRPPFDQIDMPEMLTPEQRAESRIGDRVMTLRKPAAAGGDLKSRIAAQLGWSMQDVNSASMQALRDLLPPGDLKAEVSRAIQSGSYVTAPAAEPPELVSTLASAHTAARGELEQRYTDLFHDTPPDRRDAIMPQMLEQATNGPDRAGAKRWLDLYDRALKTPAVPSQGGQRQPSEKPPSKRQRRPSSGTAKASKPPKPPKPPRAKKAKRWTCQGPVRSGCGGKGARVVVRVPRIRISAGLLRRI